VDDTPGQAAEGVPVSVRGRPYRDSQSPCWRDERQVRFRPNGRDLVAVIIFTVGALLPVAASGLTYFAQYNWTRAQFAIVINDQIEIAAKEKRAMMWQRTAITIMVLDGACFAVGVAIGGYLLLQAIRHPVLT